MKEKVIDGSDNSGGGPNKDTQDNLDGDDHHHEEEHIKIEFAKEEIPHKVESSLMDSYVIKGIQAQNRVSCSTRRDEEIRDDPSLPCGIGFSSLST